MLDKRSSHNYWVNKPLFNAKKDEIKLLSHTPTRAPRTQDPAEFAPLRSPPFSRQERHNKNLTRNGSAHHFFKFDFPALFTSFTRENQTSLNSDVKLLEKNPAVRKHPFTVKIKPGPLPGTVPHPELSTLNEVRRRPGKLCFPLLPRDAGRELAGDM